jgi:uncharacterized protein YraI
MKKSASTLLALALLLAACGTATPLPNLTDTPAPTASETLPPTGIPLPPTPSVTPTPVAGTTRAQVNVRSGPGTGFASLGLIDPGQSVEILSRDAGGDWYLILFPAAADGRGWVTAAYVQTDSAAAVPTLVQSATPTPAGPTGVVLQKLNVRSGPGTSYDSLGLLPAQSVVVLTGKNAGASWLQIEFPAAPDGHGWVTAAYIRVPDVAGLPALDQYGNPLPENTPAGSPGPVYTSTPTVGPAPDNRDSAAQPAMRVAFSPSSSRQFAYSHQLSTPQGDGQDWVEFTPYAAAGASARLTVSLDCRGNGRLAVELLQNGTPLSAWGTLQCGERDKSLALPAGGTYTLHLSATGGGGQVLVAYTLTVRNEP